MSNLKKPVKRSRSVLIAAVASLTLVACAKEPEAPTIILKPVYPPAVPSELMQRPIPAKCFAPPRGKIPVALLERDRNCIHQDRDGIISRANALIDAVEARQEKPQ
jgi:hypothetical protein